MSAKLYRTGNAVIVEELSYVMELKIQIVSGTLFSITVTVNAK